MLPIRSAESGKEIGGKGRGSHVLLCVLHLMQTDSPSLTQIRLLLVVGGTGSVTQTRSDPLSSTETYSDSFRLTQICSVSFRPIQPHSDLRIAQVCSVSLSFIQTHATLHRFAELHAVTPRFTQSRQFSLSLIQNHSKPCNSCRPIQSDLHSLRLTQS